ncbi:hypothetical protein M0802_001602 [Mischocyttarus mexicanus]|nr:hypothetical protein M0802_001602 [Mischocyttarus mexicanus]
MYLLKELSFLAICLASTMAGPVDNSAVQAVTEGTNHFSTSFFGEVAGSHNGNLITSPLSASIVLSMAAYGARGETEAEMKRVLSLPSESVATPGYSSLIKTLNAESNVELNVANKVFVNNKFSLNPNYQQFTQNTFLSSLRSLDFSKNTVAAGTINSWVEEQTHNRIKDLIQPDSINGGTAMVLVNAVYFKGTWKNQFNPKLTQDRPFHVNKNVVKNVPTMHRSGVYNYGVLPECKASFIELPYKGEEFSMVIILPDEVDGLAAIEKKLAVHGLETVLKKGHKTEVDVYLPKFKIESTLNLNEHLKNMGIRKAFSQSEADFSGMSDTGVYISEVVQKAFIEVNEEGSEAAGASGKYIITAIINNMCCIRFRPLSSSWSPPQPIQFHIDRPFLAIIQYGNIVLFQANVIS